jgi:hypothetical protein
MCRRIVAASAGLKATTAVPGRFGPTIDAIVDFYLFSDRTFPPRAFGPLEFAAAKMYERIVAFGALTPGDGGPRREKRASAAVAYQAATG